MPKLAKRRSPSEGGRKVALNMKTTVEVRAKLEALAEASGRSLTHEVEWHLERAVLYGDLTRAIREQIRQEMRAEFEARPESGFVRKSDTEYRIVSRKQFAALSKGAA